jgi:hypothetical protein
MSIDTAEHAQRHRHPSLFRLLQQSLQLCLPLLGLYPQLLQVRCKSQWRLLHTLHLQELVQNKWPSSLNNNSSNNNNPNSIQHLERQRQQQEAAAPRLSRHQISLALLHQQPVAKVQTKRLSDNQTLYVKKVNFMTKVW